MDVVLVANTNGRLAIPALAGLLVSFVVVAILLSYGNSSTCNGVLVL